MKENIIKIETVHQCNCYLGNKTLHPLVSVINLSKNNAAQCVLKFDFYTILLIEEQYKQQLYGQKYYDYSNASLLFLCPGKSFQMNERLTLPTKGCLLVFHPDLLCCTSLGSHIEDYTFFSYYSDEALHLSLREKNKVLECLYNIEQELQHAIDCHSKTLISRYIELLLDYCTRFYERQFITRNEINKTLLNQTDILLDEYIRSGQLRNGTFPTATFCAGHLRLSSHYFNDLLKFETGKNLTEYFQQKRLEAARKMILEQDLPIRTIAETLGFSSLQHFSRLFKKLTGQSPNEYKLPN